MTTTESNRKVHYGRNIKRFREMFDPKFDVLAFELGEDLSQKKVSRLEENKLVEHEVLKQVASVLHVPIESIKNFNEETAVNIINYTFNNHDNASNCQINS